MPGDEMVKMGILRRGARSNIIAQESVPWVEKGNRRASERETGGGREYEELYQAAIPAQQATASDSDETGCNGLLEEGAL